MWRGPAKRIGDLALGLCLAVLLAPVALGCAVAVRLRDGTPVLFRQVRVGRGGRPFTILKFRTMARVGGAEVTVANDPRITPVGRMLRRTKLDELPQLWNVLCGEMSFVGPRPEVQAFVAREARGYRAIAPLRPGITDWASLAFRDEEDVLRAHAAEPEYYVDRLLPRKVALARLYHRRVSLGLDLRLIAATACVVVGQDGWMRALAGRGILARARRGIAA
jgi:lipopolysaccharide/colanic/teichoic acid biosynthesis glycosyltransferase